LAEASIHIPVTAPIIRGEFPMTAKLANIAAEDVRRAYRRWAPVYDNTFGKFVEAGVRQATERINRFSGKLLEAGVGTGLALPHYSDRLNVTGIDLSPDMLEIARLRAAQSGRTNIEALIEMDATALAFPDASFDAVAAMYVMTVVPDPVAVLAELARVARPGAPVIIVNHFSVTHGLRGAIEKRLSKHAAKLGWRPEFPVETLLNNASLDLVDQRPVKPFGFFTMLEFVKRA
jgi:phosphatidylethanolamine/phosphatidyl-N-methylethanolamine N-methyltransferase